MSYQSNGIEIILLASTSVIRNAKITLQHKLQSFYIHSQHLNPHNFLLISF